MASRLDQMLEPDERVVYRTGTNRTASRVFLILAFVIVILWCLILAVFDNCFDRASWAFSTILIAIPATALAIWAQTGAAIVTNCRLLLDRGTGATLFGQQRRFALPFAEIAEIIGFEPGWHQAHRLRLTDGRVIEVGDIADPKRLAEALASARDATPENAPDATGGSGDDQ